MTEIVHLIAVGSGIPAWLGGVMLGRNGPQAPTPEQLQALQAEVAKAVDAAKDAGITVDDNLEQQAANEANSYNVAAGPTAQQVTNAQQSLSEDEQSAEEIGMEASDSGETALTPQQAAEVQSIAQNELQSADTVLQSVANPDGTDASIPPANPNGDPTPDAGSGGGADGGGDAGGD